MATAPVGNSPLHLAFVSLQAFEALGMGFFPDRSRSIDFFKEEFCNLQ